ncbi:thiamine phosphate synthase [Xanthobacter sp. AM11]|uniref:thiamine phosphate synthase n=1 Tax=Xanthobacter sp. AM11 TaxID=3380643 RepID=UPI0039BF0614
MRWRAGAWPGCRGAFRRSCTPRRRAPNSGWWGADPLTALPAPPLLLITDRALAGRDLAEVVASACAGGCRWVSLREKDLSAVDQIDLFARLRAVTTPFGVRLTLHGPPELALAASADGVHLSGGGDAAAARALLGPEALVGLSTHTLAEAAAADPALLDYITASPAFLTRSKPGHGPALGVEGLSAFARASAVPVVALAGIDAENAPACLTAGAKGVAIMGAIMCADDPRAAFAALTARASSAS